MKTVIVTGVAGFVGFHTALKLLDAGYYVIGYDNLNDYYDVSLKNDRLSELNQHEHANSRFVFHCRDIADDIFVQDVLEMVTDSDMSVSGIIHLAAQAGVRYSIENPNAYTRSNLVGFANVLEISRKINEVNKTKGLPFRLVYASSSSVYGNNKPNHPLRETDDIQSTMSYYAATKQANEMMARSYSSLYSFQTIGLRFFTVYGPWGRPDMAPMIFAKKLTTKSPIELFNYGEQSRDMTYIDDIVYGVVSVFMHPSIVQGRATVFNIGAGRPVALKQFVKTLADNLGVSDPELKLTPAAAGDVAHTWASTEALFDAVGYKPSTPFDEGIARFAKWFLDYYANTSRE